MPDGGDDKKGGLSTPVTVALIGLTGVLATAFLQNWDKLFRHQPPSAAQAEAARPATAAVSAPPEPSTAPASRADTASIAGNWRDIEGYSFIVRQDGARIGYRQFHQGRENGSAEGTLNGRDLRYRFTTTGEGADTGTCMATLSDDGQHIAGKCASDGGGPGWDFTINRA